MYIVKSVFISIFITTTIAVGFRLVMGEYEWWGHFVCSMGYMSVYCLCLSYFKRKEKKEVYNIE